jgi:hypothetical protein
MKTRILFAALAMDIGTAVFAETVADWQFVENLGKPGIIADRSGHGYDLRIEGDPARMRFQTIDGRSVLTLAGTHGWTKEKQFSIAAKIPGSVLDPAEGFTFEMWFTPGDGFKRESANTLLSQCGTGDGPGFALKLFYNRLCFEACSGTEKNARSAASSSGLETWSNGVWYHVAVVYDGSRCKLYVDGLKAGEGEAGIGLPVVSDTYHIGASLNGHANGFNGSITSAKLHDTALSGREILAAALLAPSLLGHEVDPPLESVQHTLNRKGYR